MLLPLPLFKAVPQCSGSPSRFCLCLVFPRTPCMHLPVPQTTLHLCPVFTLLLKQVCAVIPASSQPVCTPPSRANSTLAAVSVSAQLVLTVQETRVLLSGSAPEQGAGLSNSSSALVLSGIFHPGLRRPGLWLGAGALFPARVRFCLQLLSLYVATLSHSPRSLI